MTRKRKLFLFCFLPIAGVFATLILLGLVGLMQKPGYEIGAHGVSILNGATRIEAFRLDDSRDNPWPKEGTMGSEIVDYPVKFQGRTLGSDFAARLYQTIIDPRTFIGPNDVTCLINPGAAFRVWRGPECVEVIICFHCQQMLITTKNAQGNVVHTTYTEITWMRAEFLSLTREAFPNDKEVQSLT